MFFTYNLLFEFSHLSFFSTFSCSRQEISSQKMLTVSILFHFIFFCSDLPFFSIFISLLSTYLSQICLSPKNSMNLPYASGILHSTDWQIAYIFLHVRYRTKLSRNFEMVIQCRLNRSYGLKHPQNLPL